MKISFAFRTRLLCFHNILLLFAMQLLIFVLLVDRQVFAIQTVLSHSDSLNIIPLTKKNVKHFLKIFEIFFNFFIFAKFFFFSARVLHYILYIKNAAKTNATPQMQRLLYKFTACFSYLSANPQRSLSPQARQNTTHSGEYTRKTARTLERRNTARRRQSF